MIFSKEKWEQADEIRSFISVSRSLDFDTVKAPLRNAFELFIRPLLGDAMTEDLITYYLSSERSKEQNVLVEYAQRANTFLAFWHDYNEMQMLISDAGVKRQESETVKTPYKYQEQSIKSGWKEKGFNALDSLISYLEQHTGSFANFLLSPNYANSRNVIVRSANEVDKYYAINGSRIIYLRLCGHFQTVTDTIIIPRLGEIYSDLMDELNKETPAEKYVKLREMLIPVVTFYSVARLIRETGSLTDRGLFFETYRSIEDHAATSIVPDARTVMQAANAESDAVSYWKIVELFLKKEFEYIFNTGTGIPKRNNNEKKSFWT